MRTVRIFAQIDGTYTELDTFEDEQITLELNVKDIRDISKLLGSFTQAFTLPSSPANDSAFRYYFMPAVSDALNPHTKINAYIDVEGVIISRGYLEFYGGKVEKGDSSLYNVAFFAEVPQLNEVFGEDRLEDIDWSAYNHTMNFANVSGSWDGSLLSGDILYPLIDFERGWIYSSSASVNDKRNIADEDYGIRLGELKPAITFQAIIDAIEAEYDLTFNIDADITGTFDSTHMLLHREAGDFINQEFEYNTGFLAQDAVATLTSTSYADFSWTEVYDTGSNFDVTAGEFTAPEAGLYFFACNFGQYYVSSGTPDLVVSYRINTGSNVVFDQLQGGTIGSPNSKYTTFAVQMAQGDVLKLQAKLSSAGEFVIGLTEFSLLNVNIGLFNQTVKLDQLMPKEYKVKDWVNSVIKMFNLVLEPVSETEFNVVPYTTWLNDGTQRNYTEYWDISTIEVSKVPIKRLLSFKYKEAKDLANVQFQEIADRGYGSTEYRVQQDFADGEIKVEPNFAPIIPYIMPDQDVNSLVIADTGMYIPRMLDRDGKPVVDSPRIFWYEGKRSTAEYYLQDGIDASGNPTYDVLDVYPFISMFEHFDASATSYSLNFSLEEPFNGVPALNTLYNLYYGDHIERLYDTDVRLVKAEAVLPLDVFRDLRLNDQLILGGDYYTINTMKYNMQSKRASFELMQFFPNYVRTTVNTVDANGDVTFTGGASVTSLLQALYNIVNTGSGVIWKSGKGKKTYSRGGVKFPTELPLGNNNGSNSYGVEG